MSEEKNKILSDEEVLNNKQEQEISSYKGDGYHEEFFRCICHDIGHCVVFSFWEDDDEKRGVSEMYVEIHLDDCHGFFKRVWYAIRYIFGHKSKYGGAWHTVSLGQKSVSRLKSLLEKYENSKRIKFD